MFPSNPNVGDRVTLSDGRVFEWNGTRWALVTGGYGGGGKEQTPWLSDIDADAHELINVSRIGVERTPFYSVDVIGDINCTGIYRQDGEPLATGVATTAPVNPPEGKLWFDQINLRLLMWFSNQWLEITSFTPVGPGTSTWDGGLSMWDGGEASWDVGLMKNAPGEVWDRTLRRQ